ncbi:MAG: hypothetical protein ACM3P0_13910 [Acidobacteriota bacterium]
MEIKHFFTATVLILSLAISGCSEVTPPEFNNPQDPLLASYPVPVPSGLRAYINSSTEVALYWNSWAFEKGISLEKSVNGGTFQKIADLPAKTTMYIDSGLDNTKSYSYRLKRFTDLASSGYSKVFTLQSPPNGLLKMNVISSSNNTAGAFSHNRSFLATVYTSKFNQIIFWKAPQYGMDKYIDHAGKPIKAVSFSADDKLLACGAEDSSVYIYDVNSKALSNTIKGIKGAITSLDFSPEGRFLAVASQSKDIMVYETRSWTLAYTLSRHTNQVNSVCFSKDGALLASGGSDGTVIIWNTANWTAQRTINTGETGVTSVAFRPDAQVIAAAAGMSYYQFDASTGNKIKNFLTGGNKALSVTFSNDGKRFAGACGTDMSVYDSNDNPLSLDYESGIGSVFNIVLPAPGDGLFVSVGYPVGQWVPESWIIKYK